MEMEIQYAGDHSLVTVQTQHLEPKGHHRDFCFAFPGLNLQQHPGTLIPYKHFQIALCRWQARFVSFPTPVFPCLTED